MSTWTVVSGARRATASVNDRVTWAVVDRNARKGTLPSDHAPLIIDLD